MYKQYNKKSRSAHAQAQLFFQYFNLDLMILMFRKFVCNKTYSKGIYVKRKYRRLVKY